MNEAATICINDKETASSAVVIIRYDDVSVSLCLSLEKNGDVEIVMSKEDSRKIADALAVAVGHNAES